MHVDSIWKSKQDLVFNRVRWGQNQRKKNAADRDMHYTQPWPSAGAWKAKTTKEDVDSEFGLISSVSSRVKVRIGTRMSARLC